MSSSPKPMFNAVEARIDAFLAGTPHAVCGASADRGKYGNKVLRCYQQHGRAVVPINPHGGAIEGIRAYTRLAEAPGPIHGVSIITPPAVTERLIEEIGAVGIRHVWMQPGAESERAIARAEALGMNVIAGGPCLLVVLGYQEH